jgi:hypothetical protein
MAVTQFVMPGGTATIAWTPEWAGNWLFHCLCVPKTSFR